MNKHRATLAESANQVGEASATLARYRSLLAGAGSINAPAVQHAVTELRRCAAALECTAIELANAQRQEAAA